MVTPEQKSTYFYIDSKGTIGQAQEKNPNLGDTRIEAIVKHVLSENKALLFKDLIDIQAALNSSRKNR